MIGGIAQVPFATQPWLQPIPTIASYRALRALGMDGLRLQFDVSIASPAIGVWNTSLFRSWIEPAFAAGMKVNANYCSGQSFPFMDAVFHEKAAFRFAQEFGSMIESYSFGNEPGADAQAYEGADGPTAERDYMRDVYFPTMCLPFVRGIRKAVLGAPINGCDADSANIQSRYVAVADQPRYGARGIGVCDEESIHPYGEVGGARYARLQGDTDDPGFLDIKSHRPWGISEIDHQQLASARERERDYIGHARESGASEAEAALQGALARLRPTADETMALVELLRKVRRDYSDCTRYILNQPDHVFERVKVGGLEYCSFYSPEPIVSDSGRAFAKVYAEINGPVDPVKTTMPVRRRGVKK